MSGKKQKYLAKNALLFTVNSFGTKLLNFFLVPLYTNVLSTSEYGISDLITTVASLAIYAFTLDISSATLRFSLDDKEEPEKALWAGLKVNTIGSILFSIAVLVLFGCNIMSWEPYCYGFLYLLFVFLSFSSVLSNYLRAIDKVKEVVIGSLVSTLMIASFNLLFLLVFKMGIVGYLLSSILGSLFICIYSLLVIKPNWAGFRSVDPKLQKAMIVYAIPLAFNGVCWWANTSLDKLFIKFLLDDSRNGLYAVATKISGILMIFQTIFNQAWTLSAIKEFDKDDSDGFFSNIYNSYNAGMVICCSVLVLLNYNLAKILYAKDFFEAWRISSILSLTIVFSGLSGIVGSVFSAVKNSRAYATSTIIAAFVNVVLNYLLIIWMGVEGAAVSTVISFVIIWAIRIRLSRKYIAMRLHLVRDCVAYVLLFTQVYVEHIMPHNTAWFYIVQGGFVLSLLVLYCSEILMLLKRVRQLIGGEK